MSIELRVVTEDGWQLWRQVRLAALAQAPYAFGSTLADWQGPGDREERWRDRLRTAHTVVALRDGTAIGMASGRADGSGDTVALISLWVSPAARGTGVGVALVEAVEAWAAARGARWLALDVRDDNGAARALYDRLGFEVVGLAAASDPDRPELRMRKRLLSPPRR